MLSEKKETDRTPDGQNAFKAEKKEISRSEQRKWNWRILLCCFLGVGHVEDLLVTLVRRRRSRIVLRSSRSSEFNVLRVQKCQARSAMPYSTPGAFIAQIAAINRAFARGRIVIVSANAVSGHTVMLTKSGH